MKRTRRIDLFCYEVPQGSKFDLLEHLLNNEKGSFLIFVATKEGADRLAKFLERDRHKVASIHGDRSQAASGTKRCRASKTVFTVCWSPPTWLRAGFMWMTSRMS